ncbi:MAG: hypothetical protein HRU20_09995 [Pseudomonadales bacterium]|nr:hypothetical protein [Pseudomonadales bacterium]
MRSIHQWPFYPLILAFYAPFKFFIENSQFFEVSDLLITCVLIELGVIILFLLFSKIYGSWDKSAVLIFIIILGFSASPFLKVWQWSLIFTVIFIFKVSIPKELNVFSNLFSLCICALLILTTVFSIRDRPHSEVDQSPLFIRSDFNQLASLQVMHQPSIIHIVLDGYTSSDALKGIYNYNNDQFHQGLESMGFVTFNKAISPYNQTLATMSAIFLGRYWHDKDQLPQDAEEKRQFWGEVVTNGPVQKIFNDLNYQSLFVDTAYPYLKASKGVTAIKPATTQADHYDFAYYFFINTAFKQIAYKYFSSNSLQYYLAVFNNAFSHKKYAEVKEPFYLYQHVLTPHPPFFFDASGRVSSEYKDFMTVLDGDHATDGKDDLIKIYKIAYINKLKKTNQLLIQQLQDIIKSISGEYIIIVHGDHGGGAHFSQNSSSETCLVERYSPLLAMASNIPSLNKVMDFHHKNAFNLINIYPLAFSYMYSKKFTPQDSASWFIPWENINQFVDIKIPATSSCLL